MKLTASSDFRLQSRNIQQRKLRLPPFEQHGMAFSLVVAEGDILPVDVSVARLQLSDQRAFGYLSAPQKPVWSDIVGKRGKQKTVFFELPEHRAELPQVLPQERVRLPFRHGACRIPFARQNSMTPAHVWVVLFRMPAFKIFCAAHSPLEKWQPVDCHLPVRSLLAVDLCGHKTDRQKRTEHCHEYTHHFNKGLKLLMGTMVKPSSFTFRLLKSNSSSKELPKLSSTTTMKLCASSPSAV